MAKDATEELDKLRLEIDRIDGELHALLCARAAVVGRVGAAKRAAGGDAVFLRPGREARMMRALLARERGGLPASVIARIWREIVSASCQMQQPMRVALWATAEGPAQWDLVRSHFGVLTPIRMYDGPELVLTEAGRGEGAIGALPWPEPDDAKPWWLHFADQEPGRLNIVGALPFFEGAAFWPEKPRLMLVATWPPEPSGDDRSFIIAESDRTLSGAGLGDLLGKVGLTGAALAGSEIKQRRLWLVELDGFVGKGDERLAALVRDAGDAIGWLKPIGVAPTPLGVLDQGLEGKRR